MEGAIHSLFPSAMSLNDYIGVICGGSACVMSPADTREYRMMLSSTLIVPDSAFLSSDSLPLIPQPLVLNRSSMRQLINRAIADMVRSNISYREQNVLSLGSKLKSNGSASGMRSSIDQECYHINTVQNLVMTPVWQELVSRTGIASVY
jgi:hypothetical protein